MGRVVLRLDRTTARMWIATVGAGASATLVRESSCGSFLLLSTVASSDALIRRRIEVVDARAVRHQLVPTVLATRAHELHLLTGPTSERDFSGDETSTSAQILRIASWKPSASVAVRTFSGITHCADQKAEGCPIGRTRIAFWHRFSFLLEMRHEQAF